MSVHLVYLVRREGFSSVFESQVARRLGSLFDSEFEVDLVVLATPKQLLYPRLRSRWKRIVALMPNALSLRTFQLAAGPSSINSLWPESLILNLWLRWRSGLRRKPIVLMCRNAEATRIGLLASRRLKNVRVVFDCRGVVDHEFLYEKGYSFETAPGDLRAHAEQLARHQSSAAKEASGIFCVSNAMVDYLVKTDGIDRKKCAVIPCCVSDDVARVNAETRNAVRQKLGISDRLVVCYSGSLVRYQLPSLTLELFLAIKRIDPRAHFLAITTSPDLMRLTAERAGVKASDMTVLSVGPSEVPEILAAADVGLLLREHCVVNEVASPVKFAEYLACGVPVIVSDGVGDYSELVKRERIGFVLSRNVFDKGTEQELASFLAEFVGFGEDVRAKCRTVAASTLNFKTYVPAVSAAIRNMVCSETGNAGIPKC